MAEQKENQGEKVESSEEGNSEVEKSLNTLDKITVLSDLANTCRDEEIVKLLKSKPSGERVYEIFVNAVSEEIERLMGNSKQQVNEKVQNADKKLDEMLGKMSSIAQALHGLEQGPGVQAINTLSQKLGGGQPAGQRQPSPQEMEIMPRQPAAGGSGGSQPSAGQSEGGGRRLRDRDSGGSTPMGSW